MTGRESQSGGPLSALKARIDSGTLHCDEAQLDAAARLQALYEALRHYKPDAGFLARLFGKSADPPRGIYLHGDVGRGKSMLMDMFFETAPLPRKRRVHFHAFMQEIHGAIHEWRQMSTEERIKSGFDNDDPIPPLAQKTARNATLLCFDEFQVEDVADAMILGRLFSALFDQGVVIVLTSNTPPDELYEGGLNRQLFLPFIEILKQRLAVVALSSPQDYRRGGQTASDTYIIPHGDKAGKILEAHFEKLADGDGGRSQTIELRGRVLHVPRAAAGVAWFSFDDLCAQPLGAGDYLALARRFDTFIIEDIPVLGREQRNEAKRFVTLIDTLYDRGARLICSAAGPPEALYPAGDGSNAFARTTSRLYEMQSADYAERRD